MLLDGEILDNTYQVVSKIGSGGTGDVYLAYHLRLKKYVVVKKIKDNFVEKVNVRAEVDILKRLKHTCLPQVYDFIQRDLQVYTVMEYIEGNDLLSYIESGYLPNEETVIKWLKQLCDVLDYLHSQNPPIIHSDIKPANIMITNEGNVCLIDFNISLDGDDSAQISGISLPYASPEQYSKAMLYMKGQEHRYIVLDGQSDIYSLGASMYQLVTGIAPQNPYENTYPLSQYDLPYSYAIASIIDKSMMLNKEDRYFTAEEMLKDVNKIYKKTREYKLYLTGILSSAIIYLILVSMGIGFWLKGYSMELSRRYEEDNKKIITLYESGNYEEVIDKAYELLNDEKYEDKFRENKQDKSRILGILGECYFDYEDYENAVISFEEAIQCLENNNQKLVYYRDYIVSLVRNGDKDKAVEVLTEIEDLGITSTDIELINAEILVFDKKYNKAIEKIDVLCGKNLDKESKVHILVLGSEAAKNIKNTDKQIKYLQDAIEITESVSIKRKLGNAYMTKAGEYKTGSSNSKKWLKEAKDCYKDLSDNSYASFNDCLNLAICYRALEEYKESIDVLTELEKAYTDYRTYMHMAFAYDKSNEPDKVQKYVKKCLQQYKKTPGNERESEGSDNMQNIKELERKYS